jgi:hypothetical protein
VIDDNKITTSTLRVELYNASTGDRLDTSICVEGTIEFKAPLKNAKNVNLNKYRTFKEDNIDIMNPNDPAFNDRCYSYVDKDIDFDTTLNSRITGLYQGITVQCNVKVGNCTFSDISTNNYISCNCTGLNPNSEVSGGMVASNIPLVSNINIEIINCIAQAFVKYN